MGVRQKREHSLLLEGVRDPRQVLKARLLQERLFHCDGKVFKAHKCDPPHVFDLHEALYSRADLPKSKQAYAFDEHNSLLLCRWFHERYGGTKWLRQKAAEYLCTLYGDAAIQFYLEQAPLKKPLLLEEILWAVESEPPIVV